MKTMFFGPATLTRAVLPGLRERRSGTIVRVTSMGGLTTAAGFGAYCAAKHALGGLSECLAKELAPLGVRVLIVEPGAFRTTLREDERRASRGPRRPRPREVGAALAHFARQGVDVGGAGE